VFRVGDGEEIGKIVRKLQGKSQMGKNFCGHVTKKPHTNPDMSKMLTLNLWWLMIPRKTGANIIEIIWTWPATY